MVSAKKCGEAEKLAGRWATYSRQIYWDIITGELDVAWTVSDPTRPDPKDLSPRKRIWKIEREKMFWSFGAQFWPGVIARFLNGTPADDLITRQYRQRTDRLHSDTGDIRSRCRIQQGLVTWHRKFAFPSTVDDRRLFCWRIVNRNTESSLWHHNLCNEIQSDQKLGYRFT